MSGYFIDTNLLILFVVGSEDRDLIEKHRRLDNYSPADFDILVELLDGVDDVFVTPNTLTETSNLVRQHEEPELSRLMARFRYIIEESRETFVASTDASANANFARLGLTDAALLEAASADNPVLTVDLELYLTAIETGEEKAVNFTTYRDL